MNGSFKRNYEGDYHCTEDDVKAMIRDANDSGNDSVLMENYTMDDIDANTLADTAIDSAQLIWIMFGTTTQTRTSC